MFSFRALKRLKFLLSLPLIVVVLVQPVQAKHIENQGLAISYSGSGSLHLHDHGDKHVFDCHSGHVLAILKTCSFTRSNYIQIAYEWVTMSDHSIIMPEDPPPPKSSHLI